MSCGDCLHNKECHTEHNGHFMYCSACGKLCDREQFNEQFSPSSLEIIYNIQSAREFTKYKPKEHGVDLIK